MISIYLKSKVMAIVKESKTTKKNAESQTPPKKMSKLGQMMGSYADKIHERGNVWDL